MMEEYYRILGVSPDADDAEIESAYQKLRAKFSRERFMEGEIGNDAAKKLTKLEEAYAEITESRKAAYQEEYNQKNVSGKTYADVENAIKNGNMEEAQSILDAMDARDAEWHYLQSVVFYKKNRINECKNQLNLALNMDPTNEKYRADKEKLDKKLQFAENQFRSGNAAYRGDDATDRQMGGDGCLDACATLCCMQIMCNSCCR